LLVQTVKSFFSVTLFCGFFDDFFSISRYAVSNGRITGKSENVKNLEGSGRDLIDVILGYDWKNSENPLESPILIMRHGLYSNLKPPE
jgi:hypothetical protein